MPVVFAIKTAMQHSLTLAFYIDLEGLWVTPLAKVFLIYQCTIPQIGAAFGSGLDQFCQWFCSYYPAVRQISAHTC